MVETSVQAASMTVAAAQREMRQVYFGGAPGMLTSAIVWGIAAWVCARRSPEQAIWALFIGGMFIYPVGVVLTKIMGRSGKHAPDNPLASLAMATTFWMILMLPLAYGVAMVRIEWFFPAMLLIIGGRYFTFATLYGARIYWLCGAALAAAGWWLGKSGIAPEIAAAAGAAIEAVFAVAVFFSSRNEGELTHTATAVENAKGPL